MTVRRLAGPALVALMAAITAWSVWAYGQQQPAATTVRPFVRPPPQTTAGGSGVGPSAPRPPPGHLGHRPPPPKPPGAAPEGREGQSAEATEGPESPNWYDLQRVDKHGQPVPPFIAMLVNFGILAAGYYYLGRKPVAVALKSRRDRIAREIEEADKMRKEAEERATIYQAKLAHLEEEVKAARGALVHAGEAERDRVMAEAAAKAERMRKDAEFLVEQELKQIRQDLWKDTVEAAVLAAEELLKKRVTPADQERLADEYLAELGATKEPAAAGREAAS